MRAFTTTTYGKWILAGEHAVLRGCPALAFPLTSRALTLDFTPGADFDVTFSGPHGEELKLLFYGVLENALERLGHRHPPTGHFKLESGLPVGAGLGASAALCGAVGRWCSDQGWIKPDEVYEFARRLEDLFHGESSGVDLAVSLNARGVRFTRGQGFTTVAPRWWPRMYLSYSGQRGVTSDCVNKVKRLFETDPAKARALDDRMRRAVTEVEAALSTGPTDGRALAELIGGIDLARTCFEEWGLCQGEVGAHLDRLSAAGARAVKPTGSGGGGYALSVWDAEPPAELLHELLFITKPNL